MIRGDFIKRKISLIQDDLLKLATFSAYSLDEIASDFTKQAAVERILERIIMRAIDVNQRLIMEFSQVSVSPPKDYRETFLLLSGMSVYPEEFAKEIAKSVGTRNVLVHEYDNVDQSFVYQSIKNCFEDYHAYIGYVLKFVDAQ